MLHVVLVHPHALDCAVMRSLCKASGASSSTAVQPCCEGSPVLALQRWQQTLQCSRRNCKLKGSSVANSWDIIRAYRAAVGDCRSITLLRLGCHMLPHSSTCSVELMVRLFRHLQAATWCRLLLCCLCSTLVVKVVACCFGWAGAWFRQHPCWAIGPVALRPAHVARPQQGGNRMLFVADCGTCAQHVWLTAGATVPLHMCCGFSCMRGVCMVLLAHAVDGQSSHCCCFRLESITVQADVC
ncbi:hypothetical protein COO60DRAFT_809884 [Scenedesmus sp. NREL 46B-D3]|nr:hypothetical protein COO60DRAFT_809884 [Scenedesmus sp. NREL 46B-D3]